MTHVSPMETPWIHLVESFFFWIFPSDNPEDASDGMHPLSSRKRQSEEYKPTEASKSFPVEGVDSSD